MKREFTQREKVLMLVLVIVLLFTGYVKFFSEPLDTQLTEAQTRLADAQDAQLVEQTKNAQLQQMQKELQDMKTDGTVHAAAIPPYDNIDGVMVQLDGILAAATDYQLTFSDVEFGSDLVTRPIQMTFTAKTYAAAKEIMTNLYNCPDRCSLSNISVTMGDGVSVSLTATFYEQYDDAAAADDPANAPDAQGDSSAASSASSSAAQ